jgi:hypothetical protein
VYGREDKVWDKKTISKLVQFESRKSPISRGFYLNPFIGDLSFDAV